MLKLRFRSYVQSGSWLRQFASRCHARVSHATSAGLCAEILARVTRSNWENRIRGGTNAGSGSESPLFNPFLGSSLAVEAPYHPLVPVSHSSHSGPSAIAFPDSPTEAITMHNDALPAAEECRQRFTECISGLFLRKKDLWRDTTVQHVGID